LLDNVLTGKGCELVCVDTWKAYGEMPGVDMDAVRERASENINGRATIIEGDLFDFFMAYDVKLFDAIYIDGAHDAASVLEDSVLAWRLLKRGGLMIWDDYGDWRPADGSDNCPKTAVDAFLSCRKGQFETAAAGFQMGVIKL
jgi:hypothetical protein